MRENWLQEINEYVNNQGTLVQEDDFEQVPVHHLTIPLKIKGIDIMYIASDAIYSTNGKNFSFSELSDDEVYDVYSTL